MTKYGIQEQEGVLVYVLVFLEDKLAKVYRLQNRRYIKQGDFSEEGTNLDFGECQMEFDFGKIWK